jgi:hypothetical protein
VKDYLLADTAEMFLGKQNVHGIVLSIMCIIFITVVYDTITHLVTCSADCLRVRNWKIKEEMLMIY